MSLNVAGRRLNTIAGSLTQHKLFSNTFTTIATELEGKFSSDLNRRTWPIATWHNLQCNLTKEFREAGGTLNTVKPNFVAILDFLEQLPFYFSPFVPKWIVLAIFTSELANQDVQKTLFTCVVYTKTGWFIYHLKIPSN